MWFRQLLFLCFVFAFAPTRGWADIALPKVFSDHMVVQQKSNLRLWGTAAPNEALTISLGATTATAVANKDGRWATFIKTGIARGPIELEVASNSPGGAKVVVKDILVGEVWLCCGQDNMESPVRDLETVDQAIANAKSYPNIRLFNVADHQANQPLDDFAKVNPWLCCASDSIEDFSALGYQFGKQISEELKIPIGLIDMARSGITLEAWTPNEALSQGKRFEELMKHWQERNEPNNPNGPSQSFNGMIAPMTSFPIAGIIWFHGESNVGRGAQYAEMFPIMIESWRKCFRSPKLPFYFVQPAPFRYENFGVEALPEIWDAQLNAFIKSDHTGMVVSADLVDRSQVNITAKNELAKRLANWALVDHYKSPAAVEEQHAQPNENDTNRQSETAVSGPIFEKAVIENGQVVVSFRFADSGLKLERTESLGFLICGPDQNFVPANVEIKGSKLILSNAEVPDPKAVRYGWEDTFKPSLTNSSGLPAPPFRSDNYALSSQGVQF